MAEWSKAAVLKTVVPYRTGGSNPSLSEDRINKITINKINEINNGEVRERLNRAPC